MAKWELLTETYNGLFEIDNEKYSYRIKFNGKHSGTFNDGFFVINSNKAAIRFNDLFDTQYGSSYSTGAADKLVDYIYITKLPNGQYYNSTHYTSAAAWWRIERCKKNGNWELVADKAEILFNIDNEKYIYRAKYKSVGGGNYTSGLYFGKSDNPPYYNFNTIDTKRTSASTEKTTAELLNDFIFVNVPNGTYRNSPNYASYGLAFQLERLSLNSLPIASTIPNQSTTISVNKTVNLANHFSDPDGDTLTYTATSSNLAVSTAAISGSTLTLQAVALGSTTITVTANDGKGGTVSTTFTFNVVNSLPIVSLTSPAANQTLYENDVINITGTAGDADNGNTVTVRYQINGLTVRAIKAFLSTGAAEAFSKQLTFRGGNLYDDDTLIADALKDGEAHLLKVWATDDKGGQSAIVERTFYVVPNRAPRLEVTPPTIEGNIDSDTFTVSGTYADDDENEVIISYRINGSISKEIARGTDGTFDFTVSFAQLKNGNNTISVEAIDSYGAKTSRTIKMSKNTIATPLLQSTVRYLIQPPKGSAQAVLLWLQRDQDLAVTASLHMGMKGEAEAFTLLEPTNTAPLRDNAAILEDEFYHEADSAKDHIILQLDMLRSSIESTAAIHLISGVFE